MHLKQPRFTDSSCGPFTKNKERIQKIKEIYQNELNKACFQYDIEILSICLGEQLPIKFHVIKHLILLQI